MAAAPGDLRRRMASGARDGPGVRTTTATRSDPRARRLMAKRNGVIPRSRLVVMATQVGLRRRRATCVLTGPGVTMTEGIRPTRER